MNMHCALFLGLAKDSALPSNFRGFMHMQVLRHAALDRRLVAINRVSLAPIYLRS